MQGIIGEHWSDYRGGLEITIDYGRDPPQTILCGPVLMPERSAALLDGLFNWLEANIRPLVIGLFSVLGAFFLFKGVGGLFG